LVISGIVFSMSNSNYTPGRIKAHRTRRTHSEVTKLKGRCPSGKIRLRDHDEAIKALHRTQSLAIIALEVTGSTSRAEKRTYYCGMCNGFHLTSKPLAAGFQEAA
jgi:hypothetical protein